MFFAPPVTPFQFFPASVTAAAPLGGAPMRLATASCTAGSSWKRIDKNSVTVGRFWSNGLIPLRFVWFCIFDWFVVVLFNAQLVGACWLFFFLRLLPFATPFLWIFRETSLSGPHTRPELCWTPLQTSSFLWPSVRLWRLRSLVCSPSPLQTKPTRN